MAMGHVSTKGLSMAVSKVTMRHVSTKGLSMAVPKVTMGHVGTERFIFGCT